MTTTTWTPQQIEKLRATLKEAISWGLEEFVFESCMMTVEIAKYILRHYSNEENRL